MSRDVVVAAGRERIAPGVAAPAPAPRITALLEWRGMHLVFTDPSTARDHSAAGLGAARLPTRATTP
ncbi:MAG: hypothetical protein ACXVXO_05955 [Mycobacteriaceae bacterium]